MAFMALASLTFVGCDDDPWNDPWNYYDYSQGWYDDYDWYNQPFDNGTTQLKLMAQTLRGHWQGQLRYYYMDDNGQYGVADMDVDFEFDQYDAGSLNGRGREVDYVGNDSQELRFAWYIDPRTSDIYVKYDGTGKTYVLDASGNSELSGFSLDANAFSGVMEGYNNKEYLIFDCTRTTLAKDNAAWDDTAVSVKSVSTSPSRIKGERKMKLVAR